MPLRAAQLPRTLTAAWEAISQLQRDVKELRAARRLEAAAVGAGGLSVSGGGFASYFPGLSAAIFATGRWSDGSYGSAMRRNDGSLALTVGGQTSTDARDMVRLWARDSVSPIVMDDGWADGWLGRPWMPLSLYPTPAQSTASTTLMTCWTGGMPAQNPVALIQIQTYVPTGTSAAVQIVHYPPGGGSTVWASWTITGSSTWTTNVVSRPLNGARHLDWVAWDIQHRVTSGTGTITTNLLAAYTRNTLNVSEVPT